MELIKKQIEAPVTTDRFVTLFKALHKTNDEDARQMYELEKFHFMKELAEKNIPQEVTPISAMGVFLDVVSNGLSFSGTSKHVYLMSRNVKAATGYETRLVYSTQPDGKIFQCQRSGAIDYVTKPVMVYEGDDFSPSTNEAGMQIVIHRPKFPRTSNTLLAGYVYVVFKGGHREPYWMDMNDVARLKGYSAKNNGKWEQGKKIDGNPNALYTSNNGQIDPGFFGAKLINFALKNVRKSGTASQFEVNGDEGDAAIITNTTHSPSPDEAATYEVQTITTAPTAERPLPF